MISVGVQTEDNSQTDGGVAQLFVHHRSRTIGAIYLLNNTLEPRLFIEETDPSHNPGREKVVGTWKVSVTCMKKEHGHKATCKDWEDMASVFNTLSGGQPDHFGIKG